MLLLEELVGDLRDPDGGTWWAGRFHARSTLRSIVALVESAEAIWGFWQDSPEAAGERDLTYSTYEGIRRALSNEATAHSIAMLLARTLGRPSEDRGGGD